MKYEPEEFELLKEHVKEFMMRGPLGDLFTRFFSQPYPYNQTENVMDTLQFADVRKLLIDFLYRVSKAQSIEVTRHTENLIGEIWEYGYPENKSGLDFMKNLSWDLCNMAKSVDYWQWEGMRLPGESEADVVRRTYQEIQNPEKRFECLQFWLSYLERMQLKYEQEIQIADILVKLNKGLPDFSTPKMEEVKVLAVNKSFLDLEMYHDAIVYYVLKKDEAGGEINYKGFAEYEQEMGLYFSFSEEEITEVYMGDISADSDLFELLEDGYEIAAMTMDGHLCVWEELNRTGLDSVCNREGLEVYLDFCKEKYITAAAITASTGWKVNDLYKLAELPKKEDVNKRISDRQKCR